GRGPGAGIIHPNHNVSQWPGFEIDGQARNATGAVGYDMRLRNEVGQVLHEPILLFNENQVIPRDRKPGKPCPRAAHSNCSETVVPPPGCGRGEAARMARGDLNLWYQSLDDVGGQALAGPIQVWYRLIGRQLYACQREAGRMPVDRAPDAGQRSIPERAPRLPNHGSKSLNLYASADRHGG